MTLLKGFKFVTKLVNKGKWNIESEGKTKYDNFYPNSKAEILISESDIDVEFELVYTTIITNIQKSLGFSHWSFYYYFKV